MASQPLPTLEGLQQKVEQAKQQQYVVDGALEAEIMNVSNKVGSVSEDHATVPMWGEMSSGAMKGLWFEKAGDSVELKITEQFESSGLQFCAAVGPHCGQLDVYVNGVLKTTQDFYSQHAGMTNPHVDLGMNEPIDNAFTLRFVFRGSNPAARAVKGKFALGLDYFLIDNGFLKRQ
jgi:hypothetical protein